MKKYIIWLLLVGCALPYADFANAPTDTEQAVLEIAIQAWKQRGLPYSPDSCDDEIASLQIYHSQSDEENLELCSGLSSTACAIFDVYSNTVIVINDARLYDPEEVAWFLLTHEMMHVLSACNSMNGDKDHANPVVWYTAEVDEYGTSAQNLALEMIRDAFSCHDNTPRILCNQK